MRRRRTAPAKFVVLTGAALMLVGGQAVPASAAVAVMAAGELKVAVQITPPGIPPVIAGQCAPDSFTFSGGGQVASFLIGDVGAYVGPITLSGSGSSPWSDPERDLFAPVSVTVGPNSNFSGNVSCPLLTGSLIRVAMATELTVAGTCTLNGNDYNSVFVSVGVFVPDNEEGGITPITSGTYSGAFSLAA